MFDRDDYCQRYFMRKEAGVFSFIKNMFSKSKPAAASGAGLAGEGRLASLSNKLLGGPEMIPAITIGGAGIAATES